MNARQAPTDDDLAWQPLSSDLLILVCRQCRKRRDGPKHLKAKDLASTFRVATKSRRLKARTLLTSCQGLCPKDATAVVTVGLGKSRSDAFAMRSLNAADEVVDRSARPNSNG